MQDLLTLCRQKNRKAQLELYRQHSRRLYYTCLRVVGNAEDAEEAMQDSFLKIFDHLDTYREGSCFEAWSIRIAVRTAIDRVRQRKLLFESLNDNMMEEVSPNAEEQETEWSYSVEKVKTSLENLPQGYRIVLSLHWFEGFDFEEISEILKVQPSSVRSQYVRGRKKLLELMKKQAE